MNERELTLTLVFAANEILVKGLPKTKDYTDSFLERLRGELIDEIGQGIKMARSRGLSGQQALDAGIEHGRQKFPHMVYARFGSRA